MVVKIGEKEIKLKWSFRSMILYENIQGKSFTPTSTTEVLVFLYCVILASEKDLIFTFDEFLDMVDEKPELIVEFSKFIEEQVNKNNSLEPRDDERVEVDLDNTQHIDNELFKEEEDSKKK